MTREQKILAARQDFTEELPRGTAGLITRRLILKRYAEIKLHIFDLDKKEAFITNGINTGEPNSDLFFLWYWEDQMKDLT